MGSLSLGHWLIVLIVVVMIFGTAKLKNLGKDLGGAIKGLKEGMREGTADDGSPRQVTDACSRPDLRLRPAFLFPRRPE